jgi:hypothetical protein
LAVVELPLARITAQPVEELSGCLTYAFGFMLEVGEGCGDWRLHGRVACLAPLDWRLEQSSTEVDEGKSAAAWSGFHGVDWGGRGVGVSLKLSKYWMEKAGVPQRKT